MDTKLNLIRTLSKCECIFQSTNLAIYQSNQPLFENNEFVEILARWRNENNEYFITQVPTNSMKTKKWLETNFINETANMLFIVFDKLIGKMVGHIGISAQKGHPISFEIHSILRGEQTLTKHLMYDALDQILEYCQHILGGSKFYVNCFETSIAALNLYKQLKFEEQSFIYLTKLPVSGGFKWIKSDISKNGSMRMYQLELNRGM